MANTLFQLIQNMYMNLTPNKHKRISFNTTTMASLGFIDPPPKTLGSPILIKFFTQVLQLFWSEIIGSPLKLWVLLP